MERKKPRRDPSKPVWFSELLIDQTDLPLDDPDGWRVGDPRKPCLILEDLGGLAVELARRMDILEPDYQNYIFVRVPICS